MWTYACGDGATEPPPSASDPPRPASVAVAPATAELTALGATVQLRAEVRDQNGQVMTGGTVTWSSGSAAVATVDGSGLVTAAGNGTATITASASGVSGTATVTVAQTVSAVAIAPAADTLVAGDTLRLAAEATDANGHAVAEAEFAWASGDTLIAVVDSVGLVTAVAPGEVDITAATDGVNARAELVVMAPPRWTLTGTVSHGWTDPQTSGLDVAMAGNMEGAAVEIVDGPNAGRQAMTDDHGRYILEGLEEAQFTVRATAEGFAPVYRTLDLASDTGLPFAISRQLSPPSPPVAFPDTDPDYVRELAPYYPYVHHVASIRVFSDIDSTFSREHAEHARLVWDFFDDLYAGNRGDYLDVYYTTDPDVFLKLSPHCGAALSSDTRALGACYLDYPRWFVIPYQVPDFGTQLHEFGHDFLFAVWSAWNDYKWFIEGTAMYFEGGVFNGSLRVPEPIGYCTILFDRWDRQDRLTPLGELIHLGGDAFLADNHRTYPLSCMLFHYLERYHPGVLYSLIERINSKQIVTNDQLVAALLELTGKSIGELEEAYEAYARRVSP